MTTSFHPAESHSTKISLDISQLDFDTDYARLLEGKNAIVVGPAETMLGAGQGPVIDSFDLVIRFNTAIEYMPFPVDLARDLGSKTDILYCNSEVLGDRIAKQQGLSSKRFVRACAESGIKYFVGTNNDFTPETRAAQPIKGEIAITEFREFLDAQGSIAKCRMLFATPAVIRKWLSGYVGRTGFIAIVDMLRYNLRSLNITGMTFYHKGGHLFLNDCVGELDPLRNHRGILPQHMLGHNSHLELQTLKRLRDSFGERLKVDENLGELLNSNQSSDGE